ncbi:hypothetical protein C8_474 [Cannes 8 virus]|uniref:conserved putative secreted protein n=1 Tax=Melbournevirus TaxID=1560514 RepID=UPI000392C89C|nr:conserved putative secreted protein [Melbournevirus]AGV01823.1 hypothetical protein C8_474 [Cannes 8 virus]AIT55010.1 hypothetical protein MEL_397 [Melbournevirus]AVR53170.1 secreted protein [Marseillevirus Shanghai 1]
MFFLVLFMFIALFALLLFQKRENNPFVVNMVKVKSRDPSLPIKYSWWFKEQTKRPPVFMFFSGPSGQILHSFVLDIPDADKASFLSKEDVPFLNLRVKDKKDKLLWSQTVKF